MQEFGAGLCLGWTLGCAAMYCYLRWAGLFRTRREFYLDRKARGLYVPDDWEEE